MEELAVCFDCEEDCEDRQCVSCQKCICVDCSRGVISMCPSGGGLLYCNVCVYLGHFVDIAHTSREKDQWAVRNIRMPDTEMMKFVRDMTIKRRQERESQFSPHQEREYQPLSQ